MGTRNGGNWQGCVVAQRGRGRGVSLEGSETRNGKPRKAVGNMEDKNLAG